MITVVVPLVILMGLEDGKVSKVTSKVSFVSKKMSSCIVILNMLFTVPAGKVILCGTKSKSIPSTQMSTNYIILVILLLDKVYMYKQLM